VPLSPVTRTVVSRSDNASTSLKMLWTLPLLPMMLWNRLLSRSSSSRSWSLVMSLTTSTAPMNVPASSVRGEQERSTTCRGRSWCSHSIRSSRMGFLLFRVSRITLEQLWLHLVKQSSKAFPTTFLTDMPLMVSICRLASITRMVSSTVMMASFTLWKMASRLVRYFSFSLVTSSFSSMRALWLMASAAARRRSSLRTGLMRKSKAPRRSASVALSRVGLPVIMTTGSLSSSDLSCLSRSRPDSAPSTMSRNTRSSRVWNRIFRAPLRSDAVKTS